MLGIIGCGAVILPCNPSYRKGKDFIGTALQLMIGKMQPNVTTIPDEIVRSFSINPPKVVFVQEQALETIKDAQKELDCIKVKNFLLNFAALS